ncbi:MAG: hypothetical protein MJ176_05875 [Treponema sp.]|nr:hypothetical protein [Treponema sp.]
MAAHFHLPGLFEFYDFYKIFLPVFFEHRQWFYQDFQIDSIYGAPADCLWGGGRTGFGQSGIEKDVLALTSDYGVSARLTFSNSLLKENHLADKKCNYLCELFCSRKNGVILHSDLLLDYLKKHFPHFYFVSSTTKVLTRFEDFAAELENSDFKFVVPDFRFNRDFDLLEKLSQNQKNKTEFLVNECCWFQCEKRKACYENVSRLALGEKTEEWKCASPDAKEGYVFSKAKKNPGFISVDDIQKSYVPMGFSNFKIEGRSLGSALLLEFILYYMTKPEYQLEVREKIYLDNSLDLF